MKSYKRQKFVRKEIITKSPEETKKLATSLVAKLLKNYLSKRKKALILGLLGDLGGGKTTFIQGLAQGLGIRRRITSPTFVIIRKYKIHVPCSMFHVSKFYHIDCYRLSKPKELLDLGFREIIDNPKNIVAIEWADRIRKILPKETIFIKFEFVDKNKRKITLKF